MGPVTELRSCYSSIFIQSLLLILLGFCSLTRVAAYHPLSDDALRAIPAGAADFDIHNGKLLAPILIPRVPGTPGSRKAQEHFVEFFKKQLPKWTVEWHNSTARTPATGDKQIPFANLIFRRDPPWANVGDVGRLTLVAHYDSLYKPDGFVGAIDSAAPCAMLMHAARSIDDALEKKWAEMVTSGDAGSGLEEEKGVQILLTDGEEAWLSWTDDDSLYGARALAQHWDEEVHPAMSMYKNPLDSISLFVLLDLLGASEPRIPSYFMTTHWAYKNMANIEQRMRKLGVLEAAPSHPFLTDMDKLSIGFSKGFVQDDHVPFMARGVDVLHIIPTPFPYQWHSMKDDGEHLHMPTVNDWSRIVTAFIAEWMELETQMPKMTAAALKAKRGTNASKTEL